MSSARLSASLGAVLVLVILSPTGVPPAAAQSAAPGEPAWQLPLEGTSWRLRDHVFRGVERTAGPEVAAWMTLRAGRLEGSGGCTRLRGRYGVMGDVLIATLPRVRRARCAEQTSIVQQGMVDGLRRAARFEVRPAVEAFGEELLLYDEADQRLLRFVPDDVAALAPTEWRLEAWTADGRRTAAYPRQVATLAFRPARGSPARRSSSGEAVGSTGCNGFVGPYDRHADVLSFGRLELTEAPCPADLAAQEAAIMAVLESTSLALQLPPDRLVLTSGDSADSLEFVTATPLEASTWQLARLPGSEVPVSPVTLRLEAGVASGAGPCGPYTGRYSSDGLFIRFDDLRAAEDDDCADQGIERALLAALERSTLLERRAQLDRGQSQLRMLDATGRVAASFRQAGLP